MSAVSIKDKICLAAFQGYLSLLEKTVRMEFCLSQATEGTWGDEIRYNQPYIRPEQYTGIVGFWHEDSYIMNLVLKEWMAAGKDSAIRRHSRQEPYVLQHGAPRIPQMEVVVTADKRGDYIEAMLSRYGAGALRMGDGMRMRNGMALLTDTAKNLNKGVAIALDGPLGPYHEPKKLAFYLAKESGKHFCGVHVHYNWKLRLFKRWDHYVIPLPFSKVTVEVCDFGTISAEKLKGFPAGKEKIRAAMERKAALSSPDQYASAHVNGHVC